MRRFPYNFSIFAVCYGFFLAILSLLLPLHLDEILQATAFQQFSWNGLFAWIAHTPGAGPLNYLIQLPFGLLTNARFILRLPSLLFALGSCYLFFQLAKLIALRRPYWALLAFLLMPIHFYFASQARPFEQGLFLLLLVALCFFRLVETPDVRHAVFYGLALTACLYTEASSFLPAIGYVLFLLRFANGKEERRALWCALPPTVLPLFLFAPYYAWAHPKVDGQWFSENDHLNSFLDNWTGLALGVLLLSGWVGGVWAISPQARAAAVVNSSPVLTLRTRIILFCLAGGALAAISGGLLSGVRFTAFTPTEILWATPGLILVSFAAWERLPIALVRPLAMRVPRLLSPVLAGLLIALCIPADILYLLRPPGDVASLTRLIRPELGEEGCVVFVSEHLSRHLFLLFDPSLEKSECRSFTHPRIILAEHPYVTPAQKRNAELYFRGLNFVESKRQSAAGGSVVTLDDEKNALQRTAAQRPEVQ